MPFPGMAFYFPKITAAEDPAECSPTLRDLGSPRIRIHSVAILFSCCCCVVVVVVVFLP